MRNSYKKNTYSLLPTSMKQRANLSRLLCASAAVVLIQASNAYAVEVTAGNINIDTSTPNVTTYNQSTNTGVLTYRDRGFDTAAGESRIFNQPSSSSATLVRIKLADSSDKNPLRYDGNLTANGKIMIVDPNGVFFGANSRVDVAGLIASTADISDENFSAGNTNFSIAGRADASIVNKGSITAAQGGLVALIAPSVRNDGIIQANMGTVALASAQTASVDFYGDNLYSFALDKETTSAANDTKAAIENNGIISVGGGKVLLTAKVAKGVVDNVINNTGIIEANSAHMEGGTVVLDGGDGNVLVAGDINASGKTGGKITVIGENIALASANLNASGTNGGGTVKIGGDYQGKGTTPHAKTVKVDANSKINVSATDSGNGGTAIIWSDERTNFNGTILGTGGVNGGNGGFAEVSSKGDLGFGGLADLHAANGESGTLLLDPDSLFLGNIGDFDFLGDDFVKVDATIATLNTGTNVEHTAINNLSVLGDIVWSGAGSLTLNAGNDTHIESDIKSSFNGTTAQGAVNINSVNNIYLGNADISTVGGDITTNSVEMHLSNSTMKSTNGNIDINNTGKFAASGPVIIEGQSVKLFQSADGSIQNAVYAIGNVGAGGTLLQLRDGVWNEDVFINNSNFVLNGNGSGNSFINGAFPFSHVIATGAGNNDVTVSNLSVSGGTVGIDVANNSGFKLNNVNVYGSDTGLKLVNTLGALVTNSTFENNLIGIEGIDTNFTKVANSSFYNNFVGMGFDGDTNLTIQDNYFDYNFIGIGLLDVVGAPITGNIFDYTGHGIIAQGGESIVIDHNEMNYVDYGIEAADSLGIKVTNNYLYGGFGGYEDKISEYEYNNEGQGDGYGYGIGSYGIHITTGGSNTVIAGNTVDNFYTGIGVEHSIDSSIFFNEVKNIVGDAIFLNDDSHTLAFMNTIFSAANGIHIVDSSRTDIIENTINDTHTGILAENDSIISIKRNEVFDSLFGIHVIDSDSTNIVDIEENKVHDNIYGITVNGTDNVILNGNRYTNNGLFDDELEGGYGLGLFNSDNAVSTNEIFTDNILGINLDNSQNTLIREATIKTPDTRTGIFIQNGSGGTLVRGLDISGGNIGVLLDGKGSSMQFESNTSSFAGQNYYFQLQNGAMFAGGSLAQADSLDASQQKFEGVRASDFTLAQRDAAEGKTIDVEDGIVTIGNVFYKDFGFDFSLDGLDGLNQFQEFPFVAGLFSYSGRTITNDPSVTPQQFDIPALNLSLLSSGGGTPPAPAGLTASQLGGLEPAAGGQNPQALASLEPAAGGEPDCANNFLGNGFSTNFDPITCSVKQPQ